MSIRSGVLIAGVAAILWPLLAIARLPLTGELDVPEWTAPPDEIIDFYENSSFDTEFKIGIGMVILAYLLLVVFLVKVADLLIDEGGLTRWMGLLILAGGVLETSFVAGYLGTFAAATFRASHGGLTGDGYVALNDLSIISYWLDVLASAFWITALGVAIVRTRLFPRWLGWILLANGAGLVIAFFLPRDAWDAVSGLPYLWVLIAGIIMLLRSEQYTDSDPLERAATWLRGNSSRVCGCFAGICSRQMRGTMQSLACPTCGC